MARKIIDCEHHFYSKSLMKYLSSRKEYPCLDKNKLMVMSEISVVPIYLPSWNEPGTTLYDNLTDIADQRIGVMDREGVTTGLLSTSDSIECLDREESVRFARKTNDEVAEAVRRYPGRFAGTICLPTPYVDESVKELERAVNVLGLKCWHTHSSIGKDHVYEEKYEPIFAKCAELNVPFYIHPCCPTCDYLSDRGTTISAAAFGFAVDTMKTSMSLILGGIFDRHPNLTMILGHMGEFYPFLIQRMDHMAKIFKPVDPMNKCDRTFQQYFENHNILMTTSGIFDSDAILFTIRKFGIDSILFGSDYPYECMHDGVATVANLPISEEDKEKIFHKNAEKYILNRKH